MTFKYALILYSFMLAANQVHCANITAPRKFNGNGAAPVIMRQEPLEHLIAKKQALKPMTVSQLKAEIEKLNMQSSAQNIKIQNLIKEISNRQTTMKKKLEEQASLLNNVIAHNAACIDSLQHELNYHMQNPYERPIERREPPFPGCPYCG